MKNRKISAALAVIAAFLFAMSFMPAPAAAEEVSYSSGLSEDGSNILQFTKSIELEDTADIPDAAFNFEVSVPDEDIAAVYDNNDNSLIAYGVRKGIGADKIGFSIVEVPAAGGDDGEVVSDNSGQLNDSEAEFAETDNGFVLRYKEQSVTLPDDNEEVSSSVDNTVIKNIPAAEGKSGTDTYYASKTVKLDFSECGFTEPGIYRYYIQETGGNKYIINDYNNQGTDAQGWRTVDVTVVDDTTGNDTDGYSYKLKINSINVYTGKIEAGIGTDGAVTGQPAKSEDIVNFYYAPHDLTIEKTVSGNQGSRNKFFKFTIKLDQPEGADAVNAIGDDDKFYISADSNLVKDSSFKDSTDRPNIATQYTKKTIYDANSVEYVTGRQLKSADGYTFYLQHGQFVTFEGLPAETGYTVTEWPEDYTPTVRALSSTRDDETFDYTIDNEAGAEDDVIIGAAGNNFGTGGLTVSSGSNKTASVTDNILTDNAHLTFKNDRTGQIPTGVIVSVAVPAIIGIAVIGGLVFLGIRRRKENDDEND